MNRIINFHDVESKSWFESVLKILQKKYRLVSMEDIESAFYKKSKLVNACHITVDDGNRSFYENIYPVIKKNNVPATIFVSPYICQNKNNFWFQEIGFFNYNELMIIISEFLKTDITLLQKFPVTSILKTFDLERIWEVINIYKKKFNFNDLPFVNMDIETIKAISKEELITIGAHTMTHPILRNESDISSEKQIKNSIIELSKILGKEIRYFAYPNGTPDIDFGEREIGYLKEMNIKIAVSTDSRCFSDKDNPLSLPRFSIGHGSDLFIKTKLFLGKHWEFLKKLKGKDEVKDRVRLKKLLKT